MVNRKLHWPRVCGVLKTDQAASHLQHRAAQTARSMPRGHEIGLAQSRKHGGFLQQQQCVCARARVFTFTPVASNTLVARSANNTGCGQQKEKKFPRDFLV